jgi:3-methyladenine DNA glycosylase AlkD
VAKALPADRADLIQKAIGWMLRESGTHDPARLERYLRAERAVIPRTTVPVRDREIHGGETSCAARNPDS